MSSVRAVEQSKDERRERGSKETEATKTKTKAKGEQAGGEGEATSSSHTRALRWAASPRRTHPYLPERPLGREEVGAVKHASLVCVLRRGSKDARAAQSERGAELFLELS